MRKLRAKALSDVYVSKEIITVSSKLITFFGPCGCLLDFFRLPCEERVFGKNKLLNWSNYEQEHTIFIGYWRKGLSIVGIANKWQTQEEHGKGD